MSLMDLPGQHRAVAEAWRVLRPGGFLQFSITHPCFVTPEWRWIADEAGRKVAVAVGGHFDQPQGTVDEWIFSARPAEVRQRLRRFTIPRFPLTLSEWFGFFLHLRARKPREPPARFL